MRKKSLERAFKCLLPVIAVGTCLIAFACIFHTFELTLSAALYNLLLSLPLLGLLLMAVRRFPAAMLLSASAAFLIHYADSVVYSVRLTHVRFSDFMQTGQALRVEGPHVDAEARERHAHLDADIAETDHAVHLGQRRIIQRAERHNRRAVIF